MISTIDFDELLRSYWAQDEFIFMDNLLTQSEIDACRADWESVRGSVDRAYMPFVRKGGFVGYTTLQKRAPAITELYRSPELLGFLSRLTKKALAPKADDDEHACSLYVYSKPRDAVRSHYDGCGCEDAASYTVIIGLVNRSSARFTCDLFTREKRREPVHLSFSTHPGSALIFCGSKLLHGTTPIGDNEERVVISLSYVTEGKQIKGVKRFSEEVKDSLLYFGPKSLLRFVRRD